MKIHAVAVHNFRSIADATIQFGDYNLIVGENNAGKTSLVTVLRAFYEDGGVKYSPSRDFPKFDRADEESWVEIHYVTTDDEQASLKEEYRSPDRVLRVRRYFQSAKNGRVQAKQSNIYGYEGGELSDALFYGAKNIAQAKLGEVIYVPEVSTTSATLKLSGPSPFRDMLNFVMKRAVNQSPTFEALRKAFDRFNSQFRGEASQDGYSVSQLVAEINAEIEHWGVRFGVEVNPIKPEEIVKTLLAHHMEDVGLGGQRVDVESFGQGLQRHLIYTLIRLSAGFKQRKAKKSKDFTPDFTLLLFEEPEAFLHPSQQDRLDASLRSIAAGPGSQVVATTHSSEFVSRNVSELSRIARLERKGAETKVHQLSADELDRILDENRGLYRHLESAAADTGIDAATKKSIRRMLGGSTAGGRTRILEEEALRFALWMDAERASFVFARHVVICEGATEKALFDWLVDQRWPEIRDRHVYFLDAMGKYNLHRWMSLLSSLGIPHSVVFDRDGDNSVHALVNPFVESRRTALTKDLHAFEVDLETFLGIGAAPRRDLKPLHVLFAAQNGEIQDERLDELHQHLLKIL